MPDYWHIGPPDFPITVENADIILPYLPYFLSGWDIQWAGTTIDSVADVSVEQHIDGPLKISSSGPHAVNLSFNNCYDAACALASELIKVYVERDPLATCVRAGAVTIDDGLVVLMEDLALEKSNMALHMAVLGYRFFGDKEIVLRRGNQLTGTCLGLLPSVCLPLPSDCGDAFREFVEGYSSMQDEDVAYLKLWEGEAATFGETEPVEAFVLIDPTATGEAVLEPASGYSLIENALLIASTPEDVSPGFWFELTQPEAEIDFYHLRFSDSREASVILSENLRAAKQI